jgi:hypothetical protein
MVHHDLAFMPSVLVVLHEVFSQRDAVASVESLCDGAHVRTTFPEDSADRVATRAASWRECDGRDSV